MSATTLMGGETEYAIGAIDASGEPLSQPALLTAFMAFARRTLPYTSVSEGRFLRNGGFLYLDAGLHIEWATPECTSPHDVVRYLRAGDRIVEQVAAEFAASTPGVRSVFCTRCNVDYVEETLWAAHESYLHTRDSPQLPSILIPFLASRVALCGAGGWDHRSPGLRFTLSPRAGFITHVTAADTQHVRPLFHTKDEALSDTGSHRLHVGCSETLCSDVGTLLRFGTTALVVAALDADARGPRDITLAAPLDALRRFSADQRCAAKARLGNRRTLTAVDIQRRYLETVEQHLGTPVLPSWAESVCVLWRDTLDTLEQGAAALDTSLDWRIKRGIFADFLQRRGIEWSSLPALNDALGRMSRLLRAGGQTLNAESVLRASGSLVDAVLERGLETFGVAVSLEQLAALLRLRPHLMEVDMRFGALGPLGIFETLDRGGFLRHRVPGVDAIDAAVITPPQGTRAELRGEVVRRLSAAGTRYSAGWTRIVDIDNDCTLDLGNPFETRERWTAGAAGAPPHRPLEGGLAPLFPGP